MSTRDDSRASCTQQEGAVGWAALVCGNVDFAFETDPAGHLLAVAPGCVLGWSAQHLVGRPADTLLLHEGPPAAASCNPFRAQPGRTRQRVWLRTSTGEPACMLISAMPVPGRPGATRGLGLDVTAEEHEEERRAALLREAEFGRLLARRMRRVPLPFASLTLALEQLVEALSREATNMSGAMLLLHDIDQPLRIAASAGTSWPGETESLNGVLLRLCARPAVWDQEQAETAEQAGQKLLVCTATNHFIDRALLVLWRPQTDWTAQERGLALSSLLPMQPILEHEQIQRETARVGRTDVLTGLANRSGFIDVLSRRIDRLDREGLPACLIVLGLDRLAMLNRQGGLETGDAALRDAALRLRELVRPTDLVARLGGDLFALWLDGADQFAAAERAEVITRAGTAARATEAATGAAAARDPAIGRASLGIAVRLPRSYESIDSMLHRGWEAMRAVKQSGGGGWRVSTAEPAP